MREKNNLKGKITASSLLFLLFPVLQLVKTFDETSKKDHTFNNMKQKVNGVVTTIIPFKIIILLFFMVILPSPFDEPTLPAVSLCHKVC